MYINVHINCSGLQSAHAIFDIAHGGKRLTHTNARCRKCQLQCRKLHSTLIHAEYFLSFSFLAKHFSAIALGCSSQSYAGVIGLGANDAANDPEMRLVDASVECMMYALSVFAVLSGAFQLVSARRSLQEFGGLPGVCARYSFIIKQFIVRQDTFTPND